MFPYIFVYSIVAFSVVAERIRGVQPKHKHLVMIFLIILLTLFRGLRWETGADWEQFLKVFEVMDFNSIFGFNRTANTILEPGYAFMNWLISYITGSYTALLLTYNAIILLIYYESAWHYSPEKPIYVFVSIILFTYFFPLRQAFACTIFLYAIRYILSRELLKYVIIVSLAASIHITAVFMLPFYYILNRQFPVKLLVCGYFFCLVIAETALLNMAIDAVGAGIAFVAGVDSTLFVRFLSYTLDEGSDTEKSITTFIFSLVRSIFFISIFSWFKITFKNNDNVNIFYNCFFITLYIAVLFKYQLGGINRMVWYFSPAYLIFQGMILGSLPSIKRKIFYIFLLMYSAYTFDSFVNRYYEEMIPYKTVFYGEN
jgi:hypothetical protein